MENNFVILYDNVAFVVQICDTAVQSRAAAAEAVAATTTRHLNADTLWFITDSLYSEILTRTNMRFTNKFVYTYILPLFGVRARIHPS